ncbi:MAG: SGNH/GDSL hydrolase family protein [Terriglobia bacterium]
MRRRAFLKNSSFGLVASGSSLLLPQLPLAAPSGSLPKPKDFRTEPFRRMVILGDSAVQGGPWLENQKDRYPDVLARLINLCQEKPIHYVNKGISNNCISPRSPGYDQSAKPSGLERYKKDVIERNPDLFILAYGMNDMRAGMPIPEFREDMATIIRDVQKACHPVTMLVNVYYITGYRSWSPLDKGSIERSLAFNDCIRGLAQEYTCILADVWDSEKGTDWLVHYDGIHANKVGNLIIANRIFEALAVHASGLTVSTFAQDRKSQWTTVTLERREADGDPFKKTW